VFTLALLPDGAYDAIRKRELIVGDVVDLELSGMGVAHQHVALIGVPREIAKAHDEAEAGDSSIDAQKKGDRRKHALFS